MLERMYLRWADKQGFRTGRPGPLRGCARRPACLSAHCWRLWYNAGICRRDASALHAQQSSLVARGLWHHCFAARLGHKELNTWVIR